MPKAKSSAAASTATDALPTPSSRVTAAEWGRRLLSFVLEAHPFVVDVVEEAYKKAAPKRSSKALEPVQLRAIGDKVGKQLQKLKAPKAKGLTPSPTTPAQQRWGQAQQQLVDDVEGFFQRAAIAASITDEERKWIAQGLLLTRATDNRMKQMFLSSELTYGGRGFQGKGFRSLGQEAVYAGALRLMRGPEFASDDDGWRGDVVAPLIRDLGMALAFTDDPKLCLNAQAGKQGDPLDGKDLHLGDLSRGVLPAAAPLTIATCTVTGFGLSMAMDHDDDVSRVAFSFIGEGGSSLGEWHESINMAAARKWPVVYCVQNNQTALSTPVSQQSAIRTFADKAVGYGMPAVTVDGTDPESIAAAFTWAADRARAGLGPALIELVAMRMCGHAHHDDMMYLGGEPKTSMRIDRDPPERGYVNAEKYAFWAHKDPIACYRQRLLDDGVATADEFDGWEQQAQKRCDDAMNDIIAADWPQGENAGRGVVAGDDVVRHDLSPVPALSSTAGVRELEVTPAFDRKGNTYLDAVGRGLREILDDDTNAFIIGEDVGAPYGNAFLLTKEACDAHPDRVMNAPIAEGGIIGACVGAALDGRRPLGEMQFNDFVASGFNELVNNAAKMRYRTGHGVPMVLRMPWGGLRRAGPYHSQDTSPWFRRSFGLHIVAPSTPSDARALLHTAHQADDPVLFFEHIGLYREPSIKQVLDDDVPAIPLGKAAFRKLGDDLTLISYGAFVHRVLDVAAKLEAEGVSCDVIDLRSLSPIDFAAIEASVKHTGKVLLVGEDSKTGSVLESVGARIAESLFEHLDGPVRVLGSLDTPVPYSPSLEDTFLLDVGQITDAARALLNW